MNKLTEDFDTEASKATAAPEQPPMSPRSTEPTADYDGLVTAMIKPALVPASYDRIRSKIEARLLARRAVVINRAARIADHSIPRVQPLLSLNTQETKDDIWY